MEIEKKRETSWNIELKKRNEKISLTSVEISGEVKLIKLSVIGKAKSVEVEMNKEEFFNFLSIISAFKDVVIGEEPLILEEDLDLVETISNPTENYEQEEKEVEELRERPQEKEFEEKPEELNPEEWDPW